MFTKLFDPIVRYSSGGYSSTTDEKGNTKFRDFTQEWQQIIPYIGWYKKTHEGKDVKAMKRLRRIRHALR